MLWSEELAHARRRRSGFGDRLRGGFGGLGSRLRRPRAARPPARMEEELDEVARGERLWVPMLQAFYPPLRDRVDEVRKTTRRSDFTTEATDEVCSEGHPMVIRLGRNGRFLACSLYPEHKESR